MLVSDEALVPAPVFVFGQTEPSALLKLCVSLPFLHIPVYHLFSPQEPHLFFPRSTKVLVLLLLSNFFFNLRLWPILLWLVAACWSGQRVTVFGKQTRRRKGVSHQTHVSVQRDPDAKISGVLVSRGIWALFSTDRKRGRVR